MFRPKCLKQLISDRRIAKSIKSTAMVVIRRLSQRLSSTPLAGGEYTKLPFLLQSKTLIIPSQHKPILNPQFIPAINNKGFSSSTSTARTPASWLFGNKKKIMHLPSIVQAGHPVLHEPAKEVPVEEIGSDRIQKIIDDMVQVMRRRPGVGLAAPQIGIPLKIIVLEDTKEYISHAPEEENKEQDRRPFDLLVILNPKLKKKGNKSAFFFEGCLSVDGYRALVERFLEVEVNGLDRDGKPIKVDACGWQARILQHECDHLDGTLYVDKMVKRTFRTIDNVDLPLANGCPKLGVR